MPKFKQLFIRSLFLLLLSISCCKKFIAPPPLGAHGQYNIVNHTDYIINNLSMDSLLIRLKNHNLLIRQYLPHPSDPPWDSLRYFIGSIPCDSQVIEAYIRFGDKDSINTTLKILWFNSDPTQDNSLYIKLSEKYYLCFEEFLYKYNLIK